MVFSLKSDVRDLAVFGGPPAFSEKLHVGRPNIRDKDAFLSRVKSLLEGRWLTNNGPFVRELEDRVAQLTGVPHCVVTCNGTAAGQLAIRALGLTGEVILPSFTFVATVHAFQWLGITPVFCDIDPVTHNLDPDRVEELITERTSGILGVHLWGRPCAVERLTEIADRHRLELLFDAAHAFGCSYRGRMIGQFGRAELFSFNATKYFHTLEGGALVTRDSALAQRVRRMVNFGFSEMDCVDCLGTNAKMHEVSAAMGVTLLGRLDELIAVNRRNYAHYVQELAGVSGVYPVRYPEAERCNWQYVVFEIDCDETGLTRDQLLFILRAENVLARRYFYPGCHLLEPYRRLYPDAAERLPVTSRVAGRVLVLPSGTDMDLDRVSRVCQLIRFAVERAPLLQGVAADF